MSNKVITTDALIAKFRQVLSEGWGYISRNPERLLGLPYGVAPTELAEQTIDDRQWRKFRQFVFSTEREQSPRGGVATIEVAERIANIIEQGMMAAALGA